MPYLVERAATAAREAAPADFMRRAYELNSEPLRLLLGGQQWFTRVLSHECCGIEPATALVLGATPWLAQFMHRTVERTTVVDASLAMLTLCAEAVPASANGNRSHHIGFLNDNWLALPQDVHDPDIVAGDNAFAFVRYPADWEQLLESLADRMTHRAVLLSRLLAMPAGHRRLSPTEIVRAALAQRVPVNFTAVRVALLFAHWDSADYTIRPEDALHTFEEHRADFDPLMSTNSNACENDLLSIEKYRGTDATYFVPPLADALAAFGRRFHVRAAYFGPYEMSEYFPLIVAVKR